MENKALKDSEGKISYQEIDPAFVAMIAKRMSKNKNSENGKYPVGNWKNNIDILELISATERHLCDLKLIAEKRFPIHNPNEDMNDHIAAIGCNMMMIGYQVYKAKQLGLDAETDHYSNHIAFLNSEK